MKEPNKYLPVAKLGMSLIRLLFKDAYMYCTATNCLNANPNAVPDEPIPLEISHNKTKALN